MDNAGTPDSAAVNADPLSGELVRLREIHEDELDQLARWWSDPRVSATLTVGRPTPKPPGVVIEMLRRMSRNDDAGCALAVVARHTMQLVGYVDLFVERNHNRCARAGVMVGPDHMGNGYGTDALRIAVRFGFAELGLHRIDVTVLANNPAACEVMRRVGFIEEGRRRQAVYRSGAWHDEIMLSILRDEWHRTARDAAR